MKKLIAGVIVAGVLSVGGYFLYDFLRTPYPEMVLPENTLGYIRLNDMEALRKDLNATVLWKHIAGEEHREIYLRFWNRILSSVESVSGVNPNWILDKMRDDVALGVFPVEESVSTAILVGVSDEAEITRVIEQKLDPAFKRRVEDLEKTAMDYRGESFFCYVSSRFPRDFRPCYRVHEGYLILTSGQAAMNRILDVRKGNIESLSRNPYFRKAATIREWTNHLFAFTSIDEARKMAERAISPRWKRYWPPLIAVTGVDAVRALGYSAGIRQDGFTESGLLLVDGQKRGWVRIYFDQKPVVPEGLKCIPPGSHAVTVGTLPDLMLMWDETHAQLHRILEPEQYDRWQKGMAALKSLFQFDIRRDLWSALGTQFAYAQMIPSSGESDSSKTEFLLALQLRDADVFRNTLKRFSSLAPLQGGRLVQEEYRGKVMETVRLDSVEWSPSPSYYLENSWFYFSTNSAFLRKSIDALMDEGGIDSTDDYQRVSSGFPSRVNSLSYTNVQGYLARYAGMIEKLSGNSKFDWIEEYNIQKELQDLASVLYGSATCTTIDPQGLRIRSFSSIPSGFFLIPSVLSYLPSLDVERFSEED